MKTILVTGGAGFIGSNLVKYLYYKYPDYRLVVVDLLTYAGSIKNLPDGAFESERYEFWYGDIRNGELMDTLISQADVVIHLAAESHVTRSIYDNRLFFETDVLGTQTVANAVVKYRDKIQRFIHISTSEVYGTALDNEIDETHSLNPMSPYAAAKCGADRLVHSYWATYNIPSVIVRPFNNFGPFQHLEKAVPRFITSFILDEPVTIHGDGSAARDWLFVQDHCRALDMILHADASKVVGEVFNLGTGNDRSILEIAQSIQNILVHDETKALATVGAPSKSKNDRAGTGNLEETEFKFVGDRPGQVFRHTCNYSKAKSILGWQPEISFEEGMKTTVKWYLQNHEWWQNQLWLRHIPIITASGKKEMH